MLTLIYVEGGLEPLVKRYFQPKKTQQQQQQQQQQHIDPC